MATVTDQVIELTQRIYTLEQSYKILIDRWNREEGERADFRTKAMTRAHALEMAVDLVAAEGPGKMEKPTAATLEIAERFVAWLDNG